jgi:cell division protein ZapA (FtsZ GTPase activity inhibitor)
MGKVSFKVVVAGRTYPLTINEGEEEKISKAADDINQAIKLLQDNYAVKDMQDLLAMTALQLATKPTASLSKASSVKDFSAIESRLDELSTELDSFV